MVAGLACSGGFGKGPKIERTTPKPYFVFLSQSVEIDTFLHVQDLCNNIFHRSFSSRLFSKTASVQHIKDFSTVFSLAENPHLPIPPPHLVETFSSPDLLNQKIFIFLFLAEYSPLLCFERLWNEEFWGLHKSYFCNEAYFTLGVGVTFYLNIIMLWNLCKQM